MLQGTNSVICTIYVQYLYNICTFIIVHILYKYCTYIVHMTELVWPVFADGAGWRRGELYISMKKSFADYEKFRIFVFA